LKVKQINFELRTYIGLRFKVLNDLYSNLKFNYNFDRKKIFVNLLTKIIEQFVYNFFIKLIEIDNRIK